MDDLLIGEHVRVAQDAFWAVIALRFPEMHTGDLSSGDSQRFDRACREAVWAWLDGNLRN